MYGFLSGFYFFVDTQIVMNKGEINTGESNENEDVHKFNESVVSKNCCFKVKFVPFWVICNYIFFVRALESEIS
jgi:hypothetical protein